MVVSAWVVMAFMVQLLWVGDVLALVLALEMNFTRETAIPKLSTLTGLV